MAVPIEMQFATLSRVGPGNHVLDGSAHWRNLANTIEPSVCGSMRLYVKLLSSLVIIRPHRSTTYWWAKGTMRYIDGSPDPPWKGAIFWKGALIVKYRDTLRSYVQKLAESIELPFGLWARMAQGSMCSIGVQVLRDVAMASNVSLSMGYNFGFMIAIDTLFDSRGGFSGSSYPMKT